MSICPRYDCSINYSKANFDVFETLIRFVQLEPATVILGETDRDRPIDPSAYSLFHG